MSRRKLMEAIRDYAQHSLDGDCPDEGTDVLSALVNLVDTAVDGSLDLQQRQAVREVTLVEFLLAHDNNHQYSLKKKRTP